jgi:hypothetical protein
MEERVIEDGQVPSFSQMTANLSNLSNSLSVAVTMGFMSREHAAVIWKKWLSASGLDIPKSQSKGGDK